LKKNLIFSALSLAAVWLIWLIAYYLVGNEWELPSIGSSLSAAGILLTEASFWTAFLNTFLRTLAAFAFSLALGVVLALLARLWRGLRVFLAPIVSILRTVPTMAVILLLLVWTNPYLAPVVVAILVLFPAVYAAALAALDEVDETYGTLAKAYGVTLRKRIVDMYVPLTLPPLLKQAGAILSMGLKITVSGEVLASTFQSLGGMMQEAKMYLEMPRLMGLTLIAIVLGFILEGVFVLLSRIFVRWKR